MRAIRWFAGFPVQNHVQVHQEISDPLMRSKTLSPGLFSGYPPMQPELNPPQMGLLGEAIAPQAVSCTTGRCPVVKPKCMVCPGISPVLSDVYAVNPLTGSTWVVQLGSGSLFASWAYGCATSGTGTAKFTTQ